MTYSAYVTIRGTNRQLGGPTRLCWPQLECAYCVSTYSSPHIYTTRQKIAVDFLMSYRNIITHQTKGCKLQARASVTDKLKNKCEEKSVIRCTVSEKQYLTSTLSHARPMENFSYASI